MLSSFAVVKADYIIKEHQLLHITSDVTFDMCGLILNECFIAARRTLAGHAGRYGWRNYDRRATKREQILAAGWNLHSPMAMVLAVKQLNWFQKSKRP